MKAPTRSAFGAPTQGGSASGPAEPVAPLPLDRAVGGTDLHRLKWRCRRGLLENDLFIERFFRRHEETLTTRQAAGLMTLMDLADNDLLDLLLGRTQPQGRFEDRDLPAVQEVLTLLRSRPN
jgi:antitoxin CptB